MRDYISAKERIELNAECICLSTLGFKKNKLEKIKEYISFAFWFGLLIMLFVNMFLEITNV